jgi:hypothetical protein
MPLWKITLCAVTGIASTFVVAWWASLESHVYLLRAVDATRYTEVTRRPEWLGEGPDAIDIYEAYSPWGFARQLNATFPMPELGPDVLAAVYEERFGWPFSAVSFNRAEIISSFSPTQFHAKKRTGFKAPFELPKWTDCVLGSSATPRQVPAAPRLSGIAIDSVFWCVAYFGLASIGETVIHRARSHFRKRDVCHQCGYNIVGLARCPECGTVRARV